MSYYGLGYNHSFSVSEPEQLNNQEKRHDNVSDVDALMTSYMQQCVDYNEEQKKIEALEQEKQTQNEDIPQVVTISYKKIKLSEPVNFVAGDIQKGNITKSSEYISKGDCLSSSIEAAKQESCSDEQSMVDPAFVKALHTAQEIVFILKSLDTYLDPAAALRSPSFCCWLCTVRIRAMFLRTDLILAILEAAPPVTLATLSSESSLRLASRRVRRSSLVLSRSSYALTILYCIL